MTRRISLVVPLALSVALAACTSKSDSPAPAAEGGAGAAPLAACGVFSPGGACGDCKVTRCCDEGKRCDGEQECRVCAVGSPPDAVKCLENKLFSEGVRCVETKCEKECPGG